MPRVFWKGPLHPGQLLTVEGEDGHHFARVLRVRPGEVMAVASDGEGESASPLGVYLAEVEAVDPQAGQVQVRIGQPLPSREAEHSVFLVQGLAKGDKIDVIVQKCTEVGVAGIAVVPADRSVVRIPADKVRQRVERWRKVAREAASQAQRDRVPDVWYLGTPARIAAWLRGLGQVRLLLLDEALAGHAAAVWHGAAAGGQPAFGLRSALRQPHGPGRAAGNGTAAANNGTAGGGTGATVIAVGPEGGWSDQERRYWVQELGAIPVSLGPRVLRTETAGLVAASAVLYEYGELGG